MAKPIIKKMAGEQNPSSLLSPQSGPSRLPEETPLLRWGVPLLLAAVAFFSYWSSLKSDFVYDARTEILKEGFITSLSNLPAVLSLKVLGMNLMLGDRPGQLLYLMVNAVLWGTNPWGYHLTSNLLHAANVGLLYILLRRLTPPQTTSSAESMGLKVLLATVVATLIFALHPMSVEAVAGVSYSSDLLATFFTLLALLAATAFQVDHFRASVMGGLAGIFCALAAVTCKESGITATFLLMVYWFFYRRGEATLPWLLFLFGALAVSTSFLEARFFFQPLSQGHLPYLGGSISSAAWIQPRLWVFMMGQLLWPEHLSADYTLENVGALSTPLALMILIIVLLLQMWLASASRLGALGVAMYWVGLATVSNFFPLFRFLADRFYYLPLAGVAMQLLALSMITLSFRFAFWALQIALLIALIPLTLLTLQRQEAFTNDFALWTDTLRASPFSWVANNNIGLALYEKGEMDDAIKHYEHALLAKPDYVEARNNFANALLKTNQLDEAIAQYQKAVEINPNVFQVHDNLGFALYAEGRVDQAIGEYRRALDLDPDYAKAHNDLGIALARKGQLDDALVQFQAATRLAPDDEVSKQNEARAQAMIHQRDGAE